MGGAAGRCAVDVDADPGKCRRLYVALSARHSAAAQWLSATCHAHSPGHLGQVLVGYENSSEHRRNTFSAAIRSAERSELRGLTPSRHAATPALAQRALPAKGRSQSLMRNESAKRAARSEVAGKESKNTAVKSALTSTDDDEDVAKAAVSVVNAEDDTSGWDAGERPNVVGSWIAAGAGPSQSTKKSRETEQTIRGPEEGETPVQGAEGDTGSKGDQQPFDFQAWDAEQKTRSDKVPVLKPLVESSASGLSDRQVAQWELGMELRLSELGKQSDTELLNEDRELKREQKWLITHRAADQSSPGVWVWLGIFCVLLTLFVSLFVLCLRLFCAEASRPRDNGAKDRNVYRPGSQYMYPNTSEMLDRHANLRATSVQMLTGNHINKGTPTHVQTFVRKADNSAGKDCDKARGSGLHSALANSTAQGSGTGTDSNESLKLHLQEQMLHQIQHRLPKSPRKSSSAAETPRLDLSLALKGSGLEFLFGSKWKWLVKDKEEVIELCSDGSLKADSAGTHAHWWTDEQARINMEWGNRFGLHILLMDRSKEKMTGVRVSGGEAVQAELVSLDVEAQKSAAAAAAVAGKGKAETPPGIGPSETISDTASPSAAATTPGV